MQYIDDRGINVNSWEPTITSYSKVNKIWGVEYLLSKYTDKYAMKRLEILKDKCISLQYHVHKNEVWHIVEGTGIANLDGHHFNVAPGDTVEIAAGMIHQVKATSDKLIIIEASTTELDDVVRLNREFVK